MFATDDLLAASALEWAHDIGRRVPDDLRVVGFDGTLAMRRALPGLTTVQQPIAALCATAVDLLARRIDSSQRSGNESDEVPPVELPVTLIVGRTS